MKIAGTHTRIPKRVFRNGGVSEWRPVPLFWLGLGLVWRVRKVRLGVGSGRG